MIKLLLITLSLSIFVNFSSLPSEDREIDNSKDTSNQIVTKPTNSPKSKVALKPLSTQKVLPNGTHAFQTFNNCGPAALSMTLSYFDIKVSQQVLGQALRPYQNANGDNDDKSVTLDELAAKAIEYELTPYHRPNGNIRILQAFINEDIPVVTRTWLTKTDDIGHFRVVKGFDQSAREIIQDDSLQGKNKRYSYEAFLEIWQRFNYEYLVLIPHDKLEVAQAILGEDADANKAWKKAVEASTRSLQADPDDIYERFNLAVALYQTGKYKEATIEYEKVESKLPFRTLWYQIEPILAYFKLKDYDRVMEISEKILNNNNRAYSELYMLRGEIYKSKGDLDAAKREFENAVKYKSTSIEARRALDSLNN